MAKQLAKGKKRTANGWYEIERRKRIAKQTNMSLARLRKRFIIVYERFSYAHFRWSCGGHIGVDNRNIVKLVEEQMFSSLW